jgi:hypothetical protein
VLSAGGSSCSSVSNAKTQRAKHLGYASDSLWPGRWSARRALADRTSGAYYEAGAVQFSLSPHSSVNASVRLCPFLLQS